MDSYKPEDFHQLLNILRKTRKYDEGTLKKCWEIIQTVVTVGALKGGCDDLFDELKENPVPLSPSFSPIPQRSLNPAQKIRLHQYFRNHLDQRSPITGLWLIYLQGLGPCEACNADFSSIQELKHHPRYCVLSVPGSRSQGKHDSMERKICLPNEVARELLNIRDSRIKLLQKQNLDRQQT